MCMYIDIYIYIYMYIYIEGPSNCMPSSFASAKLPRNANMDTVASADTCPVLVRIKLLPRSFRGVVQGHSTQKQHCLICTELALFLQWISIKAIQISLILQWLALFLQWISITAIHISLILLWIALFLRWISFTAIHISLILQWLALFLQWISITAIHISLILPWIALFLQWISIKAIHISLILQWLALFLQGISITAIHISLILQWIALFLQWISINIIGLLCVPGHLLAISGVVFRASLDFSILRGCLQVLKKSAFLYVNLSDFAFRRLGSLLGTSGASRHLRTNIIDFTVNSVVFTMN